MSNVCILVGEELQGKRHGVCVMNWSGLEEDPGRFLVGGDLGVKDWVSVLHDVGIDVELVEDDVLCFLKQN